MKKYIYGIDVGGTTVKIGLFDLSGLLLKKWEILTNKEDSGKHILSDIYKSISKQEIDPQEVLGYGFGVPGPVVQGFIVRCVNLGWEDFDLRQEFSELTGNSNIHVENDANAATLGETWSGAAKGYKNSAMLTIGTGIGGGFVADTKVVDGAHGAAGEIGHMKVVHEDGILCNCGNKGCLETVASATGIKSEFNNMKATTHLPSELRDKKNVTVEMIFNAAKAGDLLCLEVIDKVTYYIGYSCHVLSVISNPDVIVIGGGVSNAGDFFVDRIKKHFYQLLFKPVENTIIVLAELGNNAGIYGAASLVSND